MKGGIAILVAEGLYREALSLYAQLHSSSLRPTNFTFPFLLKACGNLLLAPSALQIHAQIVKTGFQNDIYTATALTDMYMTLQITEDALKVFEGIPHRSLPSFNSIVSGFSQNGCFREALFAFKRLQMEGFFPNSVTIAGILPACGRTPEQGSQFHGISIKLGHELDDFVVTALVTMYLNCRDLGSAQRVFQTIGFKKVVSYNAMISGLFRNGFPQKALDIFKEMMFCSWVRPNSSTLVSVSSICSELSALHSGKQIHCYILKHAVGSDITLGTSLLDMYCKCGSWEHAHEVFLRLNNKDLITWNSFISGLLSHGRFEAAVELFHQLEMEGLGPDMTTWNVMISGYSKNGNEIEALRLFTKMLSAGVWNPSLKSITSLLQACSSLCELQYGKEIHAYAIRTGIDTMDEFFPTSLVHMYMKSGCSLQAGIVFDRIENKSDDPALWNSMISGYGRNGENKLAFETFRKMLGEKIKPDSSTFLSILSVCSHTGQVEKGWELFKMMSRDFGIDPIAEHFSCVVDLLGRAGKLSEAWELLQEIPCTPSTSVYTSLLGACKCYSDSVIGKVVAERLSELEPGNPIPFVILSNIYAEQGRWNEVERLREMMIGRGLKKNPGCSWIYRNERELVS